MKLKNIFKRPAKVNGPVPPKIPLNLHPGRLTFVDLLKTNRVVKKSRVAKY